MIENTVKNWLRQLLASPRAAKRAERPFSRWIDQTELLEDRQVLSAVTGTVPAEVDSSAVETQSAKPKHAGHSKAAVQYPNVAGTWNLTASAVIDGDEPFVFTGTVNIVQNKGKVTGTVNLVDLPTFTIKGKLSKTNVLSLSGSTKFPVDFGDGVFREIKGDVTINYAQGVASFNGTVNRTIFGHTIVVTLTGSKQA